MDAYTLKPDEVLLFKNTGTLKGQPNAKLSETIEYELLLTNQNIVIIKTTKKMFSKSYSETEVYPVSDIKTYNDEPQVKQNRYEVDIYFTAKEITFSFHSNGDARKFVNEVFKLVTGKSSTDHAADRAASRVKKGINRADDTLGISTVGTVKSVLENGIARSLLGGISPRQTKQAEESSGLQATNRSIKQTAVLGAIDLAKDVWESKKSKKNSENDPLKPDNQNVAEPVEATDESTAVENSVSELDTYDQKLDIITKMKSLVDAGVLTQEEFEQKKKELLQL